MSAGEVLQYVVLGILLGAVGQLIRFIRTMPRGTPFAAAQLGPGLLVAAVIGGVAGAIGSSKFLGDAITSDDVLTLIGIGYIGADVIDGFIPRTQSV